MGWEAILITAILLLLAAFMTGAPLFVAFLAINLTGVAIFIGQAGFGMVANSIFDTANYTDLATIPLFVLMAEILFRSGSVDVLFDAEALGLYEAATVPGWPPGPGDFLRFLQSGKSQWDVPRPGASGG